MSLLLDAGALIGFERGDPAIAAKLQTAVDSSDDLRTTSMIVAQAWRDGRRQVSLARLLSNVEIVAIDEDLGRQAGELLGVSRTADPIDASLVILARPHDRILTSDPTDIRQLVAATGMRVRVVAC